MHTTTLPEIDLARCTGCGDCAQSCPHKALMMQAGRPVLANPEACTYCADCEEHCASRAIRCAFEITWEDPEQGYHRMQ